MQAAGGALDLMHRQEALRAAALGLARAMRNVPSPAALAAQTQPGPPMAPGPRNATGMGVM
jgi:hypothetical protein